MNSINSNRASRKKRAKIKLVVKVQALPANRKLMRMRAGIKMVMKVVSVKYRYQTFLVQCTSVQWVV